MTTMSALAVLLFSLALVVSAEEYYEAHAQEPIYYAHGSHGGYEYLADGSDSSWGGGGRLHQQSKCEDIPANMSLCQNIGYTKMRLPNLLDHDTMTEMLQQARPWVPLLGLGCHENTKLFLCSLFSPVCVDRPIYPCRTFCEDVKAGCESRMLKYGYPWPEMLRCDKFPLDNDLCLGPQAETAKVDESSCAACDHPQTFEAFVDSFCTSDFAIRVRIDDQVVTGNDLKLTVKSKKKKYKAERVSKRDIRNLVLYVDGGATCDCPQLTSASGKDRMIVMGNKKDGGRLVISNIYKFDKQAKHIKQALKAVQKPDFCKEGLWSITEEGKNGGGAKDGGAKGAAAEPGKKDRKKDRKGRKDKGSDTEPKKEDEKAGKKKERRNKKQRDSPRRERNNERRRRREKIVSN